MKKKKRSKSHLWLLFSALTAGTVMESSPIYSDVKGLSETSFIHSEDRLSL